MLLIFDWDGTLIDSSAKIVVCMQRAAASSGLPALGEDEVKNIIGLSLPEAIRTLYPQTDDRAHEHFREHYAGHYLDADRIPCELFPGVMKTLEQLKRDGHTLTVATGKARRGLDRILGNMQLLDFFHASRCADETQSKPHPQMLHELLEQFGKQPREALMVGDTTFDMEMAQRAAIPRIAVSYGVHDVERLKPFAPIAILDRFPDLQKSL